ncbi:MAG: glycosyltransferase family 2 protein [Magnetococcales bacterium]|nr:glycosyltransferase family 2 protein [Magnetococcales bacterium]
MPTGSHERPGAVTVAIPCFRAARVIEAALDAWRDQDWPPAEIIVIDDGSDDATAARVAAWQARNPSMALELIRRPCRQGIGASRNRALSAARTEWLLFTSADCIADARCLGQFRQVLTACSAQIMVGAVQLLNTDSPYVQYNQALFAAASPHATAFRAYSLGNCVVHGPTVAAHGIRFDETFWWGAEDMDFEYAAFRAGMVATWVPNAVVWRTHDAALWPWVRHHFTYGWGDARLLAKCLGLHPVETVFFDLFRSAWFVDTDFVLAEMRAGGIRRFNLRVLGGLLVTGGLLAGGLLAPGWLLALCLVGLAGPWWSRRHRMAARPRLPRDILFNLIRWSARQAGGLTLLLAPVGKTRECLHDVPHDARTG